MLARRLERLQGDMRVKTLKAHRIRCGLCDAWIALSRETQYAVCIWLVHIELCERKRR